MSQQNILEHIKNKMELGQLTADEANVELVLAERVRIITNSVPRDVRTALNAAVKTGKLAHIKKQGHKPEAYYHPNFEYLMKEERGKHENHVLRVLKNFANAGRDNINLD